MPQEGLKCVLIVPSLVSFLSLLAFQPQVFLDTLDPVTGNGVSKMVNTAEGFSGWLGRKESGKPSGSWANVWQVQQFCKVIEKQLVDGAYFF